MKTIHVAISGRVQGVGFRNWTVKQAKECGLTGWVRNLSEGSVEAVFYGDENALIDIVMRCHKGPRFAKVERVLTTDWQGPVDTLEFIKKDTV